MNFFSKYIKVEWYNLNVDSRFKLDYSDDTFCVLVLNTPRMFEKLFLPYLFDNFKNDIESLDSLRDPIDGCMCSKFDQVKNKLDDIFRENGDEEYEIKIYKDYEIEPATRRAKILMQTCGHISGAAYYYSQNLIKDYQHKEKVAMIFNDLI